MPLVWRNIFVAKSDNSVDFLADSDLTSWTAGSLGLLDLRPRRSLILVIVAFTIKWVLEWLRPSAKSTPSTWLLTPLSLSPSSLEFLWEILCLGAVQNASAVLLLEAKSKRPRQSRNSLVCVDPSLPTLSRLSTSPFMLSTRTKHSKEATLGTFLTHSNFHSQIYNILLDNLI